MSTHAAESAGISFGHAYMLRKKDAAFRAAWLEALGTAYSRLELVLLDRAFNGTEKVIKRKDGSEERMLEYSNQLGLSCSRCIGTRRRKPRSSCPTIICRRFASGCSTSCNGCASVEAQEAASRVSV